ncbi:MAG: hypothetical protein F6K36_21860 [Symploca sp. SIO3C6]|nr:hypothetical protein [Symploca sp. SIO3C6]NET07863.1 hypothetical protein [Symploca sp. SIO2B6]
MTSENTPFNLLQSSPDRGNLKVIAFGDPKVVENYILTQYRLGYAEVNEWSRPLPTTNPGEVMSILIKRVSLDKS